MFSPNSSQIADMSEKDWNVVMRNNELLYGLVPGGKAPKEWTLANGTVITIPSVTVPTPPRKAYVPGTPPAKFHVAVRSFVPDRLYPSLCDQTQGPGGLRHHV